MHSFVNMLKRGLGSSHLIQVSELGSKKGVSKGQLVMLWKMKALWAYSYLSSFIVWGPRIQFLDLRLDWKMVGVRFYLQVISRISYMFWSSMNYFWISAFTYWIWGEDWFSFMLICCN